jgi:hypothetical protein
MRILLTMVLAALIPTSEAEVIKLPAPGVEGKSLALHCVEPVNTSRDAVLFIHGASFPTMLAAGFEFEGKDSWMNFTANYGRTPMTGFEPQWRSRCGPVP